MNNEETLLPTPRSLESAAKELDPQACTIYLEGFGAALLTIAAGLHGHAQELLTTAAATGKIPHPVTVMQSFLALSAKYVKDNELFRETLSKEGVEGLQAMITLMFSNNITDTPQ